METPTARRRGGLPLWACCSACLLLLNVAVLAVILMAQQRAAADRRTRRPRPVAARATSATRRAASRAPPSRPSLGQRHRGPQHSSRRRPRTLRIPPPTTSARWMPRRRAPGLRARDPGRRPPHAPRTSRPAPRRRPRRSARAPAPRRLSLDEDAPADRWRTRGAAHDQRAQSAGRAGPDRAAPGRACLRDQAGGAFRLHQYAQVP